MKLKMYLVALLTAVVGGACTGYSDEATADECVFGFRDAPIQDPALADLLKRLVYGGAVRACPTYSRGIAYYILSDIRQRDRVRYYYQREIFLESRKPAIEWSSYPPKGSFLGVDAPGATLHMCPEEHVCDTYDASGFVPVTGLSTYLFRKLQDAWDGILKSKGLLDRAIKDSPRLAQPQSLGNQFLGSAEAFLLCHSQSDAKIRSAGHKQVSDIFDTPIFEFSFGTPRGIFWSIHFDYDDSGIRILGISEGIE